MKFRYSYNTKDNVRRDGVINAARREDVFTVLKAQGIKPYGVELVPGILNKLPSLRLMLVAVVLVIVGFVSSLVPVAFRNYNGDRIERRQIYGDQAIIDAGESSHWSDVFEGEAEQFLAMYALPGRNVPSGKMTDDLIRQLKDCLNKASVIKDDRLDEYRQIRDIVKGMKEELREFIEDGGSVEEYVAELISRQATEVAVYEKAVSALENARSAQISKEDFIAAWKRINGDLREMGIRTVPLPEEFSEKSP